ncbi:MAG: Gfo/Idh/MocA family oxidoreductase [Fimbriimonadaceae bacterium]|nr:Gfo/Idh/MocA family oxidoreductase [Fimbriimonadaceae bacterium]
MRRLTVAIVGLTPIGARRPASTPFGRVPVSHAAGYATHRGCLVTAVCDRRYDLVQACREAWEDTWPALAGYTRLEQLLTEACPDLLSVCTPDDRHAEVVVAAATAGVRGILCEQPLATSTAAADRMMAAAETAGCRLLVHHNRRYDPLFHLVREVLRLGEIGELRHLRCTQAGPRAMLLRQGVAALDLLCFLAGSPVNEVSGRLERGFEGWRPEHGDGGHDPRSEPTASARLRFANGLEGAYDGLRTRHQEFACELIGSEGSIRVRNRHAELVTAQHTQPLVPPPYDTVGLAAAVADLCRVVREGGRPLGEAAAARHALAVVEALLASAAQDSHPVAVGPAPEAA